MLCKIPVLKKSLLLLPGIAVRYEFVNGFFPGLFFHLTYVSTMLKYLLFVFALLPLAANAQSSGKAAKGGPKGAAVFGEAFKPKGVISYDQMLKEIQGKEKITVKVRGTVDAVCQAKGCWMNLVSGKEGQEKMMVQFKDYGFFMPKDIAGREVVIDGYAYYEVTPVDELRHYAEDAGKTPEEIAMITEPAKKLKFLASGVLLMDKGK